MIKFVSSNVHKYEEIDSMLKAHGIECSWVNMKYEEIQEDSIEKISWESCNGLIEKIDSKFFIEDSGIIIEVLGGFPGPYSSYVQRTIGNEGILKLLEGKKRNATFVTVISYWEGHQIFQFDGKTAGTIATSIFHGRDFGYDPIFIPNGKTVPASLLSIEEKNQVSQRGKAMIKFIEHIKETEKEI